MQNSWNKTMKTDFPFGQTIMVFISSGDFKHVFFAQRINDKFKGDLVKFSNNLYDLVNSACNELSYSSFKYEYWESYWCEFIEPKN